MKNRIKEIREAAGLSQAELARRMGTSAPSISRYEAEDGRITMPLLQRLAEVLDCDPVDLISDNGFSDLIRAQIRGSNEWVLLDPRVHKSLLGKSGLEVIQAQDDSMAPTAVRGDMCIIDTAHIHVQGDGLYAFAAGEQTYIKRAAHNAIRHTITITSDNPVYPPMGEAPAGEVDVVGRVVGLVKSL